MIIQDTIQNEIKFYNKASKRLKSYGIINITNFIIVTGLGLYLNHIRFITIIAMIVSFSVAVFDFVLSARYKKLIKVIKEITNDSND